MTDDLRKALAEVPEKYRGETSWGSRYAGGVWAARVGPVREFGHVSPAAAILAAVKRFNSAS